MVLVWGAPALALAPGYLRASVRARELYAASILLITDERKRDARTRIGELPASVLLCASGQFRNLASDLDSEAAEHAIDAPPVAALPTTTHSAARMLKQLFAPTKGNLLGWAAAAAVVGAWQYFASGPDAVDGTLAFNQKIINDNKKKP